MKFILTTATLFLALNSSAGEFKAMSIWTGNNNFSGAPSPRCICDKDMNTADCALEYRDDQMDSEICYDEFVPVGSQGWAWATVYKKSGK